MIYFHKFRLEFRKFRLNRRHCANRRHCEGAKRPKQSRLKFHLKFRQEFRQEFRNSVIARSERSERRSNLV